MQKSSRIVEHRWCSLAVDSYVINKLCNVIQYCRNIESDQLRGRITPKCLNETRVSPHFQHLSTSSVRNQRALYRKQHIPRTIRQFRYLSLE